VGVYPTMVEETYDLDWLSEVVSHEWVHNFLSLRPLGINYLTSPELRTMNETAASIAGKEIGRAVLEEFYPELLPPPSPPTSPAEAGSLPKPEPPAFDFNKEMHKTRITVDQLLSEGKVEEAEAYMEQRRRTFLGERLPLAQTQPGLLRLLWCVRRHAGWCSGGRPGRCSGARAAGAQPFAGYISQPHLLDVLL